MVDPPSLEIPRSSWTKPWTTCFDSSVHSALSGSCPGWPPTFLQTWLEHLWFVPTSQQKSCQI